MGFVQIASVCSLPTPFARWRLIGNVETGLADDNLFSNMVITPMSTLINAVQEIATNPSLTGVTAEISGEKFTLRHPPEYVDDITKLNFDAFWRLGYA